MRSDFAATPLGSIAHIEMGQSPDSSTVREGDDGGVPFLQGNAEFGVAHPTPRFRCVAPMKMCRAGDILISVRAPVGAMNIADRDYCIGRGLAAVRVPGMSPTIAAHMVSAATPALRRVAQGTTFEAISKADLASLVVMAPPQADREALGLVLDTLEHTIRQTESIIEKLKQVKQGLLHDLLTRGIDANGELRPPQSEAPHLYKASPLGWIPSQWRVATLADLADVRSGTTPARSAASRYFAGGETAWVKTLDLNEGVVLSTDERVTDAALRECSCERLPVGTVLIAMYGGWEQIGRTAILGVPAATNQAISALVFGTSYLEPEYVLRAVQHGRPRWSSAAASTRKDPNITKADVSAFRISLPESRDEQLRIVGTVRAALKRVETEQAVLSQLQHLKSGLMEDLLTGRVRVTPLLQPEAAS